MLTHNSMLSLSGDAIWNISCSRQLVTTIQRHSAIVVLLLASSTWFCLPLAHTCCCCPGPVLAHSPASSSHRPHLSQWSQEPVYACPGTYNSQQVMLRKRDPLSVPSPLSWATNQPLDDWHIMEPMRFQHSFYDYFIQRKSLFLSSRGVIFALDGQYSLIFHGLVLADLMLVLPYHLGSLCASLSSQKDAFRTSWAWSTGNMTSPSTF